MAEDLTNLILQQVLTPGMRHLVGVKTFNPADVGMRAKLDSWLLVAELRAAISSALPGLFKTLSTLEHADLTRGVMRVSLAKEHFPAVASAVLADKSATFDERNQDLGKRMQKLNKDVCTAFPHHARYWLRSVLQLVAEEGTKAVSSVLDSFGFVGGGDQPARTAVGSPRYGMLETLVRAAAQAAAAAAASAVTQSAAPMGSDQPPIVVQIRSVLSDLAALLHDWKIAPVPGLGDHAQQDNEEVQSTRVRRRADRAEGFTRTLRSSADATGEHAKFKRELQGKSVQVLKLLAKELGVWCKPHKEMSDATLKLHVIDALLADWRYKASAGGAGVHSARKRARGD